MVCAECGGVPPGDKYIEKSAYDALKSRLEECERKLRLAQVGSGHYRSERDIHIKEQETFNAESVAKIKELSEKLAAAEAFAKMYSELEPEEQKYIQDLMENMWRS